MSRTVEARPWLDVAGEHLEGVVWDPGAGRLRFVDLFRGHVYDVDPADLGSLRRADLPAPVTAVAPTTSPDVLLVADGDGAALVRTRHPAGEDDGRPTVERLADPLAGRPEIRMNDGAVGPGGRYFAGSMAYDMAEGAACLYRVDPDGSLHTVLTGVTISNGIDWSPDGTRCYFADTPLRRIDVFDHDPRTGELTDRRVFADTSELPGVPDGLTVDAEGSVWVAFYNGWQVCAFAPDGRLEATVPLPVAKPTSCCIGGPGLDTLYITTSVEGLSPEEIRAQPGAGGVFVADPGRHGVPPTPFPLRQTG